MFVRPVTALAASAVFLGIVAAGAMLLARSYRGHRLTTADRITLLRAALVATCAGLAADDLDRRGPVWAFVGVASAALLLDAVDGWVARRRGEVSAAGARFDGELDALFVLVLTVAVLRSGHVGAWVLAAGAVRYAFGAAGLVWPALRAPLPPMRGRRFAAGWQEAALTVAVLPVLPRYAAVGLAGSALAAVTLSFTRDARWLLRQSPRLPHAWWPRRILPVWHRTPPPYR